MAKLYGELKIKLNNLKTKAIIEELFVSNENAEPITSELIIDKLDELDVMYGYDKEIIDFYVEKVNIEQSTIKDVIIACEEKPHNQGSQKLNFLFDCEISPFDDVKWSILDNSIKNFNTDHYYNFPFETYYLNNGDKIAILEKYNKNKEGTNLFGDKIQAANRKSIEFQAGEGVFYDEKSKTFKAGSTGYLVIKENVIHIRNPFHITKDKMKLYFKNFLRHDDKFVNKRDFAKFISSKQIPQKFVNKKVFKVSDDNRTHHIFAQGIEPEPSEDGKILYKIEHKTDIGKKDEHGNIDFKEKTKYKNVQEDDLLIKKQLPISGKNGYNIFDEVIKAKVPRDISIKGGLNTKIVAKDNIQEIRSTIDGVLDIKNNIYSVFPEIRISGDVDYDSGNLDSKANLVISGDVKGGFKVISKKNIIIHGVVENNAYVEAGGSIEVKEGIIGEDTIIQAGGNVTSKFIESSKVKCGGSLMVQRFVMGATIDCLDKIMIMGTGINLRERGCLVDSTIKVRNSLTTPAIGSIASLKNIIYFGHDEILFKKIDRMTKTRDNIIKKIDEIKEKYEFDITANNVHSVMKNLTRTEKDAIINDINQIKRINNKLKMIEEILQKDLSVKEKLLKESYVEVSQTILPPIIFHVIDKQKTIDKLKNHKRYVFDDSQKIIIEVSNY